ncbi:MAG: 3'-5' exonuclease [Verrucomicrobiota bacterium]|nr:3'-5' exonuclease [Verrucomicrobiota bacterium]
MMLPRSRTSVRFALLALAPAFGSNALPAEPAAPTNAGADHAPANTTPLTNVTFVAFDTETTGLSARNSRAIEIAAVRFRNGVILAATNWLINPGMPIPTNATRVNGITDAMVSNCPPFRAAFPAFAEFARGSVLLAHNARFDAAIIRAELLRNGLEAPPNLVLDTLELSKAWYPAIKSHSLENVVRHIGVDATNFHRAQADSESLARIVMLSFARFLPRGTLGDLKRATPRVFTLR